MTDILENLSAGFVMLAIASLLVITIGFLADSSRSNDDFGEPEPLSRSAHAGLAFFNIVLLGFWAYSVYDLFADEAPDWFLLITGVVIVLGCLVEAYRHTRDAFAGNRTVDS
ncbi:MAG: hypothetical protein ABJK59_12830 [Erythrobacter sp.]|uniref:hypothetical protein n=1 Tax=Erythrobacter sp. TaxID=1042 RepID=UPI0032988C94